MFTQRESYIEILN